MSVTLRLGGIVWPRSAERGGMHLDQGTGDGSLLHGITSESSRTAMSFSGRESGDIKRFLSLPLVSVVVINFNYGRFLRAAVDSVFGQTYPNVECIVVDNGSTDESGAVLQARFPRDAGP